VPDGLQGLANAHQRAPFCQKKKKKNGSNGRNILCSIQSNMGIKLQIFWEDASEKGKIFAQLQQTGISAYYSFLLSGLIFVHLLCQDSLRNAFCKVTT